MGLGEGQNRRGWRAQRGSGILSVLATTILLYILLLVAARVTTGAIGSAFQDQSVTAAFHAAEAGLNHLIFAVGKNPNFQTGELLPADTDGDGQPNFGAGGELGWVLARAQVSGNLLSLTAGEAVFTKPAYADGSRAEVLYAVGYISTRASARATRVVKIIYLTGFVPRLAILTENDLLVSGNPVVAGDWGSIHSNEDTMISGNPTIEDNATAAGSYTESGNPTIGGYSGGGAPRIRIPAINPSAFLPLADYELRADGVVYAGQTGTAGAPGTFLFDTKSTGLPYRGWKQSSASPSRWDLSGNTGYDGTYYVEGDATISGNPGSPGTPWVGTVIATGYIEVSGNPVMTADAQGFGLVAGTDLKINGNPSQSYDGAMLAREQLLISGNPTIIGYLVAADEAQDSGLVTGPSTISGNAQITYSGTGAAIPGGITVDLWQELVAAVQ